MIRLSRRRNVRRQLISRRSDGRGSACLLSALLGLSILLRC